MSVRSHTIKPRTPHQPNTNPAKPIKKGPGLLAKTKSAAKRVVGASKKAIAWVQKNEADYLRATGESSLGDDLRRIPMRVIRETGKLGREESERIRCRRDSDEDICGYVSGRGRKSQQQQTPSREHLEFVVAPKRKPRPKKKVIHLEYDPDAEVY